MTEERKSKYGRYIWVSGEGWIPIEDFRTPESKSANVITDEMSPLVNQVNGKIYTSKSELRKSYRAAGVIEVGNDKFPTQQEHRPQGIREDLSRAFRNHKWTH